MGKSINCLIFLGILIFLNAKYCSSQCHTLPERQGMRVACRNPRGVMIPCHTSSSPTGSTASYGCADLYIEKRQGSWRHLKCNKNKFWDGFDSFRSFQCQPDCGVVLDVQSYILGGNITRPSMFPWHATVFHSDKKIPDQSRYVATCGGTLIEIAQEGLVILTAAHCLAKDGNMSVILGSIISDYYLVLKETPERIYNVTQFKAHEDYKENRRYLNDIAILQLDRPIILSSNIIPACVSDNNEPRIEIYEKGVVAGFGVHDKSRAMSSSLQHIEIPVVASEKCYVGRTRRSLSDHEICAGYASRTSERHRGTCLGDSGGGFIFEYGAKDDKSVRKAYVQGIVSHGNFSETGDTACQWYTVFTKVSAYSKWLQEFEFGDNDFCDVSCPKDFSHKQNTSKLEDQPEDSTSIPTTVDSEPDQHMGFGECGIPTAQQQFLLKPDITNSAVWPWNAAIFYQEMSNNSFIFQCGGTLIETLNQGLIILTAAHCLADDDNSKYRVALGATCSDYESVLRENYAQVYRVRKALRHENYRRSRVYENDIAALQLDPAICLSSNIIPACLSRPSSYFHDDSKDNEADIGEFGDIVGFGHSKSVMMSAVPHYLKVEVVSANECNNWRYMRKLSSTEICTKNVAGDYTMCFGNAGAGLLFPVSEENGGDEPSLLKYYLQGIVSHGPAESDGMGECLEETVLTRVKNYISWINNIRFPGEDSSNDRVGPPRCDYSAPHIKMQSAVTSNSSRTNSTVQQQFSEFQLEALHVHNFYRQRHQVSSLTLNAELSRNADYFAELCIRQQNFPLIGKNVFQFREEGIWPYKNPVTIVRQAVEYWYNQTYEFRPQFSGPISFTQIVWKLTTHIGVGLRCINGVNWRRTVIVVTYFLPCNANDNNQNQTTINSSNQYFAGPVQQRS